MRTTKSPPEIDRIRNITRAFIFANYGIQRRAEVFAVSCPKTQINFLNSAKREQGISRKRLVRGLTEFGASFPLKDKS